MPHQLALAAGCVIDTDAFGVVAAASIAGFDAVGLRISGPHVVVDADALCAAASDAGVAIHDVEVHRIGGDADATELLEVAAAIGATAVLVVSDLASVKDSTTELTRLARRCDRLGLTLGLEYMAWTTPSTPRAAIEVASRAGCRLVVDVLHHVRVGAGVDELHSIVAADLLGWLQLCDAPATAPALDELVHEARHARLAPGDGGLPLAELLAEIPDGIVVSVEVQSDAMAAEFDVIERARLLHAASQRVLNHRG